MKNIITLLVVLSFISCQKEIPENEAIPTNNSEEFNAYKPLQNTLVRTISIPNDTIYGQYGKIEVGFESGREIIYATNLMANIMDNFDLAEATHFKTNRINNDPALFNVPLSEIIRISEDSIFLFGPGGRLFLVDNEMRVTNQWNFSRNIEPNDGLSGIDPLNSTESFFLNGKSLFVRSYPAFNWDNEVEFYEKPFMVEYDLEKNEVIRQLGYFPKFMTDNKDEYFFNDYKFSWLKSNSDKNKLLVSFRRSHHLMVLDLETGDQSFVPAKSNYLDRFNLMPRNYDPQNSFNALITNGIYHRLIYDQYRDVYYRIVAHDQPLKNPITNRLNSAAYKPFSIIVLDKDLNYLGESTFENYNRFSYLNISVCSEGLLFFVKNESNESVVQFDIFNIIL